jgi:hypothetical protein
VFGTACPGVDVCGTGRASGCDEQFVIQTGSIEMAEGRLLTNRNCAPTVRFVTSRTLRWVAHADRMVCNKPTSNCVKTFNISNTPRNFHNKIFRVAAYVMLSVCVLLIFLANFCWWVDFHISVLRILNMSVPNFLLLLQYVTRWCYVVSLLMFYRLMYYSHCRYISAALTHRL